MSDATGSISVPMGTAPSSRKKTKSTCECKYPEDVLAGPMGVSRDTWAKVLLWLVPIIFSSGAFFYSYKNTDMQVKKNEKSLFELSSKQQSIYTEQRVQANTLGTIKGEQKDMKRKVDSVDGKLDDQKDDLALIKAKLRIHETDDG